MVSACECKIKKLQDDAFQNVSVSFLLLKPLYTQKPFCEVTYMYITLMIHIFQWLRPYFIWSGADVM